MVIDKQRHAIYPAIKFIMVNNYYEKVWGTLNKKGLCYP
jgi:hypothetical protein